METGRDGVEIVSMETCASGGRDMGGRVLLLTRTLIAGVVLAALLPVAGAVARPVPPGNSAVNQYTETFPTAGGPKQSKTAKEHARPPAQVLGAGTANRLAANGPAGQAAATVAAQTAPASIRAGAAAEGAKKSGGAKEAGGDASLRGSDGSSGLGEILAQATGTASSGTLGVFLPLIIAATLVWSVAFLWRRRRTA
jgi:cobalamin biosynthesis Mg chelatase CobN